MRLKNSHHRPQALVDEFVEKVDYIY